MRNILEQHIGQLIVLKIGFRSQVRRGFWWGGGLVA